MTEKAEHPPAEDPLAVFRQATCRMGQAVCRSLDEAGELPDVKTLRELAATLKELTCLARNLYDLPTAQERSAMQIAWAKLELERKEKIPQDDEQTGVIEIAAARDEQDLPQP